MLNWHGTGIGNGKDKASYYLGHNAPSRNVRPNNYHIMPEPTPLGSCVFRDTCGKKSMFGKELPCPYDGPPVDVCTSSMKGCLPANCNHLSIYPTNDLIKPMNHDDIRLGIHWWTTIARQRITRSIGGRMRDRIRYLSSMLYSRSSPFPSRKPTTNRTTLVILSSVPEQLPSILLRLYMFTLSKFLLKRYKHANNDII